MRSRFVSDRTAKPRHSSSFHSHVSFLLVILQMMSPSPHGMFLGFLDIRSLSSDSANIQSAGTTIAGMMTLSSASCSPDNRALIGDSYWPSLATCDMLLLSASCGAMNPLIMLYHKYLCSAPAYAFLVPSSSLRHAVASYELPISRSASSRKAPGAFLTRTACLSRSPVPLSPSEPPPLGTWGSARPPQRHPNLALWNAQWRLPQNLHGREGGLVQSRQVPLLVQKCLRPLIHRNSKSSGRPLLGFSVPSRPPPSRVCKRRSTRTLHRT